MNRNDQTFIAQKIRTRYMEQGPTAVDEVKQSDARVRRPANVFGSIGAPVAGAGMSFVMTDIGATLDMTEPMVPGIIIGIVGLAMAACTDPICKEPLSARQRKYAGQIMELSDRILNE